MQLGFKNEQDFSYYFNNKKVKKLPIKAQELLYAIFSDINEDSFIECWCSKYLEKADIKIRINGVIKGISIKTGQQCSMHQEHVESFSKFLLRIGIEENIILKFQKYIIGEINGKRVDSKTYIKAHSDDIEIINKAFNSYYNKLHLIMRFIFHGTELQLYDCDAIIYGTTTNFIWATKDEIMQYLTEFEVKTSDFINVSLLNVKCYDRNLTHKESRKNKESQIQIKWLTLPKDIMYLTKIREAKVIKNNKHVYDYFKQL